MSTPNTSVDVLIIGAGLSGLQAALSLQKAGITSYLILEARNRIGGKTLSQARPDGKGKQELGAAWINDSNQQRMWALATQLGMAGEENLVVQNTTGDVVVQDFAGEGLVRFPYGEAPAYAAKSDSEDCVRIRDLVEATSLNGEVFRVGSTERTRLDSVSFEEYMYENGVGRKGRATARVWTHAMLGVDPGEISALYFLEYCRCGGGLMTMRSDRKDGGQYLRFKSGTSMFAKGLEGGLKGGSVLFNSPVLSIEEVDGGSGVQVTTKSGNLYNAKKVIVSVPTPVYKHITWSPPLPHDKMTLARQTRYGHYTKYLVLFAKPFWRESGFCGLSQSFIGPVSVTRDTSVDTEGNYAITCFMGGTFARKWSAGSAEEKKASVLLQIGAMLADGEDITDLCTGVMESPWHSEEYSGFGCPCPVSPPGTFDKGVEVLCRRTGHVHFVGTETARTTWRGYMEGALCSGERGAEEVISALGKINGHVEASR